MFRTGYITNFRGDLVWFLGLPLFALACALASQAWLSAVALASCALWVNTPHLFSTIIRAYGLEDDRKRFGDRLIVGLIVICAIIFVGIKWFPLTLILLISVWNHQHFLMQLHGFTRIYDFKAKTGDTSSGHFDLALNWVLYVNMFLTAPLFTKFWVREAARFGIPVTYNGIDMVQTLSITATGAFGIVYLAHAFSCLKRGHALNPVKYLFLFMNYSVLYYVAFHTSSLLVHGIANMIMHSIQYQVIIFLYMQRKMDQEGRKKGFVEAITRHGVGGPIAFVVICTLYALIFQLMTGRPLDEFGFGVLTMMGHYGELPAAGFGSLSEKTGTDLFFAILVACPGLLHLYYDSFIWKVRETKSQAGL